LRACADFSAKPALLSALSSGAPEESVTEGCHFADEELQLKYSSGKTLLYFFALFYKKTRYFTEKMQKNAIWNY
jgi:hypothetical protein